LGVDTSFSKFSGDRNDRDKRDFVTGGAATSLRPLVHPLVVYY